MKTLCIIIFCIAVAGIIIGSRMEIYFDNKIIDQLEEKIKLLEEEK